MTKAKLCKDCIYFKGESSFEECRAPQNTIIKKSTTDLVTGVIRERRTFSRWLMCERMRSAGWFTAVSFNMCGKSGRWFKPKSYT